MASSSRSEKVRQKGDGRAARGTNLSPLEISRSSSLLFPPPNEAMASHQCLNSCLQDLNSWKPFLQTHERPCLASPGSQRAWRVAPASLGSSPSPANLLASSSGHPSSHCCSSSSKIPTSLQEASAEPPRENEKLDSRDPSLPREPAASQARDTMTDLPQVLNSEAEGQEATCMACVPGSEKSILLHNDDTSSLAHRGKNSCTSFLSPRRSRIMEGASTGKLNVFTKSSSSSGRRDGSPFLSPRHRQRREAAAAAAAAAGVRTGADSTSSCVWPTPQPPSSPRPPHFRGSRSATLPRFSTHRPGKHSPRLNQDEAKGTGENSVFEDPQDDTAMKTVEGEDRSQFQSSLQQGTQLQGHLQAAQEDAATASMDMLPEGLSRSSTASLGSGKEAGRLGFVPIDDAGCHKENNLSAGSSSFSGMSCQLKTPGYPKCFSAGGIPIGSSQHIPAEIPAVSSVPSLAGAGQPVSLHFEVGKGGLPSTPSRPRKSPPRKIATLQGNGTTAQDQEMLHEDATPCAGEATPAVPALGLSSIVGKFGQPTPGFSFGSSGQLTLQGTPQESSFFRRPSASQMLADRKVLEKGHHLEYREAGASLPSGSKRGCAEVAEPLSGGSSYEAGESDYSEEERQQQQGQVPMLGNLTSQHTRAGADPQSLQGLGSMQGIWDGIPLAVRRAHRRSSHQARKRRRCFGNGYSSSENLSVQGSERLGMAYASDPPTDHASRWREARAGRRGNPPGSSSGGDQRESYYYTRTRSRGSRDGMRRRGGGGARPSPRESGGYISSSSTGLDLPNARQRMRGQQWYGPDWQSGAESGYGSDMGYGGDGELGEERDEENVEEEERVLGPLFSHALSMARRSIDGGSRGARKSSAPAGVPYTARGRPSRPGERDANSNGTLVHQFRRRVQMLDQVREGPSGQEESEKAGSSKSANGIFFLQGGPAKPPAFFMGSAESLASGTPARTPFRIPSAAGALEQDARGVFRGPPSSSTRLRRSCRPQRLRRRRRNSRCTDLHGENAEAFHDFGLWKRGSPGVRPVFGQNPWSPCDGRRPIRPIGWGGGVSGYEQEEDAEGESGREGSIVGQSSLDLKDGMHA